MTDLPRIARLSHWLYWAAIVLGYVLPLVLILTILRGWFDPPSLVDRFPDIVAGAVISPLQASLVAGLALIATLPLIATFLAMARLFARYRRGEILSDACAADILSIGRAMLFLALATVLLPSLQVLVLSFSNPPGQRVLSVGVDGGTLGFLLSAGLLSVIGWVMREAARIKSENEGFV